MESDRNIDCDTYGLCAGHRNGIKLLVFIPLKYSVLFFTSQYCDNLYKCDIYVANMRCRICSSVTWKEAQTIDNLISNGLARSRSDFARLAMLRLIEQSTKPDNPKCNHTQLRTNQNERDGGETDNK